MFSRASHLHFLFLKYGECFSVSMSQSHEELFWLPGWLSNLVVSVRLTSVVWFFISGCCSSCVWIGGGQLCYHVTTG